MKSDDETTKQLTEGEHVKYIIESEGWRIVKAKLDARILDIQNINNLDASQPLEAQLIGRKLAADQLFAFQRDDVYGFIEQQNAAKDALNDAPDSSYVARKPE
jgi:hypothetical protein